MRKDLLTRALKIVALVVLTGWFLKHAKPFLAPIVFAGLFSMLLLPLSKKLEGRGWSRGLSVTVSLLTFIIAIGVIVGVLYWQVSDLAKNSGNIEQNVNQKIQEIREYLTSSLGISQQKQEEIIQKQRQSSSNKVTTMVTGAIGSLGAALTNILIVLVYIFLFLFYRTHLKNFVFKLLQPHQRDNARTVMEDGRKVAQKYLTGMAMMIASLWVMYSIGFSIVGVKNAIFFAILCGLLEIVPFVGNLAGNAITVFMAIAQGGSMSMVIGILIVYGTVQFIQSYFIEPLVVGKEVNIHPMFTIMGIIAGEFIWGIPGMVLAIPVMGVAKIICDHVEPLKPFGYLLGEEKGGENGLVKKIKGMFKRK